MLITGGGARASGAMRMATVTGSAAGASGWYGWAACPRGLATRPSPDTSVNPLRGSTPLAPVSVLRRTLAAHGRCCAYPLLRRRPPPANQATSSCCHIPYPYHINGTAAPGARASACRPMPPGLVDASEARAGAGSGSGGGGPPAPCPPWSDDGSDAGGWRACAGWSGGCRACGGWCAACCCCCCCWCCAATLLARSCCWRERSRYVVVMWS
mmetsp:Transcript_26516/g.67395  ORF Transcript_26516/g.67395 Transcript_26516/m.67395 type:complete len:212 (+) Transcript_26516:530-1165(+)